MVMDGTAPIENIVRIFCAYFCAYSLDDPREVLIGASYSTWYFSLLMRKTGRFTIRLLSPSLIGSVKVSL